MLDDYVRDVIGSFLLFFIAIGPVVYHTYFRAKKEEENVMPKLNEIGNVEDDKYLKMLKSVKAKEEEKTGEDGGRISFEEYEAFLKKLEEGGKLEKLELSNPRSAVYKELMNKQDK
jgi:hypothetical protein